MKGEDLEKKLIEWEKIYKERYSVEKGFPSYDKILSQINLLIDKFGVPQEISKSGSFFWGPEELSEKIGSFLSFIMVDSNPRKIFIDNTEEYSIVSITIAYNFKQSPTVKNHAPILYDIQQRYPIQYNSRMKEINIYGPSFEKCLSIALYVLSRLNDGEDFRRIDLNFFKDDMNEMSRINKLLKEVQNQIMRAGSFLTTQRPLQK